MTLEVQRRDYSGLPLDEASAAPDPLAQFHAWFAEAQASAISMVDAMALATATAGGTPSVRMVLLKGADERGFVWFTNYTSRKGHDLEENPRAALLFYWEPLHRQIRLEGAVEQVDALESNAYFASRPRAANLSAMASPQSQPLTSRRDLEERVDRLEATWHGHELERPIQWGGYRLIPARYEFWQGRQDRLHDRLLYVRGERGWERSRLAP
jgi:pyridoxamine 5'-phosphate oxidase